MSGCREERLFASFLSCVPRRSLQGHRDALGRPGAVQVNLASVEVSTDTAIPLALVVNELLTNALKYGRPPYRVVLQAQEGRLVLAIGDSGSGPATDERRIGLGSRLVEALAKQLAATRETTRGPEGYRVELTMPLQPAPKQELDPRS
jgi:two-component sensor histidine kinase